MVTTAKTIKLCWNVQCEDSYNWRFLGLY